MRSQRIAVLGSTGSVGTQALDVIEKLHWNVEMLTGWQNTDLLAQQIRRFQPRYVAVRDAEIARTLQNQCGSAAPQFLWELPEVLELIRHTEADQIVHAIAGLAGLPTALAAADSGKRLNMANKEAVIAAGEEIFQRLRNAGGELIPVDSEHCAIFQCMGGTLQNTQVQKILLTASGGPFFGCSAEQLQHVTLQDTLAHPTWKMGPKITVDSATLMNKGFEIMEAVRLFGIQENQIEVLIHRQSIIHSMVEYTDHTVIAQMSYPDMRSCIQYALTYPARENCIGNALDFTKLASLTFAAPDTENFPLLNAARDAIREGGWAPAALIAADEAAVSAFLSEQIAFCEIAPVVLQAMEQIPFSESHMDMREAMRKAAEAANTAIRAFHGMAFSR